MRSRRSSRAVGGRTEVWVDGGIRRGLDVVTAVALGARGVLVGRPILWALAAAGEAGVERALEILRIETVLAMTLLGTPTAARRRPGPTSPAEAAAASRRPARLSSAGGSRQLLEMLVVVLVRVAPEPVREAVAARPGEVRARRTAPRRSRLDAPPASPAYASRSPARTSSRDRSRSRRNSRRSARPSPPTRRADRRRRRTANSLDAPVAPTPRDGRGRPCASSSSSIRSSIASSEMPGERASSRSRPAAIRARSVVAIHGAILDAAPVRACQFTRPRIVCRVAPLRAPEGDPDRQRERLARVEQAEAARLAVRGAGGSPSGAWVWGSTATASIPARLAAVTNRVGASNGHRRRDAASGQPSRIGGSPMSTQVASRSSGMTAEPAAVPRARRPAPAPGPVARFDAMDPLGRAIATRSGFGHHGWNPIPAGIGVVADGSSGRDRSRRTSPSTANRCSTSYGHGQPSPPPVIRNRPSLDVAATRRRETWPWIAVPSGKLTGRSSSSAGDVDRPGRDPVAPRRHRVAAPEPRVVEVAAGRPTASGAGRGRRAGGGGSAPRRPGRISSSMRPSPSATTGLGRSGAPGDGAHDAIVIARSGRSRNGGR